MPGGRPLKFKSVEEVEAKLDAYFAACDAKTSTYVTKEGERLQVPDPEPYTITGMALALDTDRKTLINYQERDEFFNAIRRAKQRCEHYAEKSLYKPKIATGVIFNLTNNYGWKDAKELHGPDGNPLIPSTIQVTLVAATQPPQEDTQSDAPEDSSPT